MRNTVYFLHATEEHCSEREREGGTFAIFRGKASETETRTALLRGTNIAQIKMCEDRKINESVGARHRSDAIILLQRR